MLLPLKRLFIKDAPSPFLVRRFGGNSQADLGTTNFVDGIGPSLSILLLLSRIRLTTVAMFLGFSALFYNEFKKEGSFVNVRGKEILSVVNIGSIMQVNNRLKQASTCVQHAKPDSSFLEIMNCIVADNRPSGDLSGDKKTK